MDLNKYIEDNFDSFKLIGDSTNKVYIFEYQNKKYILKRCNMNENNTSIFWQYLENVFGYNFHDQINNLEILYKKLSNEFIPIAKPVFINPLLKDHVYEKINGKDYSPDTFPENTNIHLQLGKFIGNIHKLEYKNYGAIYAQNKDTFENAINNFAETTFKKHWTNRDDIKKYFNTVFQEKTAFDNFALIMPDISANQFVFSDDMTKINGVVDLDAYIIGPKELELTIIEMCIPNNECANYFKKGYELFGKLPLLEKHRKIFRFVSFLCDPEYNENIEKFMAKNVYYE